MDNQELIRAQIAFAKSEHVPAAIELIKDCSKKNGILGKTQWDTIVNALTLEIQGDLLKEVVDKIEELRRGNIINK